MMLLERSGSAGILPAPRCSGFDSGAAETAWATSQFDIFNLHFSIFNSGRSGSSSR
jgi:hypothetical protein